MLSFLVFYFYSFILIFVFSFSPYGHFAYIFLLALCFSGVAWGVKHNEWVSAFIFDSCAFSWTHFLLVILSYSHVCVLFYLTLFYFIYPLVVCLFSNERQKWLDPDGIRSREELGNGNQGILYEKIYFQ